MACSFINLHNGCVEHIAWCREDLVRFINNYLSMSGLDMLASHSLNIGGHCGIIAYGDLHMPQYPGYHGGCYKEGADGLSGFVHRSQRGGDIAVHFCVSTVKCHS